MNNYLDADLLKSINADLANDRSRYSSSFKGTNMARQMRQQIEKDRQSFPNIKPFVPKKRRQPNIPDLDPADIQDPLTLPNLLPNQNSQEITHSNSHDLPSVASAAASIAEMDEHSDTQEEVSDGVEDEEDRKGIDLEEEDNVPVMEEEDPSHMEDTKLSKVDKSSYYFFKSTDPEMAEQFKPKKVDSQEESGIGNKSSGSLWNTGATMEQYDYSQWFKERLKSLLSHLEFPNSNIEIVKVKKIEGSATVIISRGQLRPGWDISFQCKWKGTINGKKVSGSFNVDEVCDSEDSTQWLFDVSIGTKKSVVSRQALTFVKMQKKLIFSIVEQVIQEMREKRD